MEKAVIQSVEANGIREIDKGELIIDSGSGINNKRNILKRSNGEWNIIKKWKIINRWIPI